MSYTAVPEAPSPEPAPRSALTRPQRLDRLPFTRRHLQLVVGAGVGWALDAMDVGLMSFVMATLTKQWHLDETQTSWLASIGFVGMAIGASLGGLLADRVGRRSVFALTLLLYGIATGASALATGLAMLLVLRFVVGLGLGAELPVASTLVTEYAPSAIRGRIVVALESFWAVGWLGAALIAFFVVPNHADGWRWAFALGMVPALYAVVVRIGLPESVRFLESKGREHEAEAAVRTFETPAGVPAVASPPAGATPAAGIGDLFAGGYARRTLALWVTWFCVNFSYYGAFLWMPTLLVAQGFTITKSFGYVLIMTLAQLPGYALAAVLIEVIGRRITLATFLAGSALSALGFAHAGSDAAIITFGCLLSMFNLGAWGALYAVTPEIYPTRLRATGAGQAAGFGRIASILAPLSVPWLRHLSGGGTGLVFTVFCVAFAIAAGAALLLPEHRGDALEQ